MKRPSGAILISIVFFSMISLISTPAVSGAAIDRITLPFFTSWENTESLGRSDCVDYKKDFYGYNGPNDPLPQLERRSNEITPPSEVFGWPAFGSNQLRAAGYFGASYSYCYFSLFDQTPNSDVGPPIRLKEHTFINIWYCHTQLKDCMIDGEIYNQRTGQFWTLRDFCLNGAYIVDQDGVRIHPAWRNNDALGIWKFACFDLSMIHNSDPEAWCITKIWIGFDNGNSQAIGQARTYFDMLHITYGGSNKETWNMGSSDASVVGSAVVWSSSLEPEGYKLHLKLGVSAFDAGYIDGGIKKYTVHPTELFVDIFVDGVCTAMNYPAPTGINLTQRDPSHSEGDASSFVCDFAWILYTNFVSPELGFALDLWDLCEKYTPSQDVPAPTSSYAWPLVGREDGVMPHFASGEVFLPLEI
jgi:hypothetical protein